MTKEEMLRIMRLLSALESLQMYSGKADAHFPDYLLENISECVEILEREVLK